jgi:3-isopropylmalate dehydrogenase
MRPGCKSRDFCCQARLNGDDIGHEIVPASVAIARAAAELHGVAIDWRPLPIGAPRARNARPHAAAGNAGHAEDAGRLDPRPHRPPRLSQGANAINPHPILRKQFNLFANVRPTRSYPDIGCLHDNVDLVIVRENNEGFQPDRNMLVGNGEFRPTTRSRCPCASSRARAAAAWRAPPSSWRASAAST